MGMFDSFLGQNSGYTKAQRAGLGRSEKVKKKRKALEAKNTLGLEREKMKFKADEADKVRGATAMTQAQGMLKDLMGAKGGGGGGGGYGKPQQESQYDLQKLKGTQAMDLAKFRATEIGLAEKRALTRSQLGAESAGKTVPPPKVEAGNWGIEKDDQFNEYLLDKKTGKTKALTLPGAKPVAAQGPALDAAPGGNKYEALPPTISTVLDMERNNPGELPAYMDWMKKNKQKEFLAAAEGYKKFHNPQPADTPENVARRELPRAGIYQNKSGTYTNY